MLKIAIMSFKPGRVLRLLASPEIPHRKPLRRSETGWREMSIVAL
jgi:hypothetical protein